MSPEKFLANFGVLAETPGGVKKLRAMILELAVRGRLAPQDSREVTEFFLPVSRKEGPLVESSEKPGRRIEQPQPVSASESLFKAPSNWRWARFTAVASIESNLVDPANFGDWPHIAPDNIEKGTGKLLPYRTIREDGVSSVKHQFKNGQILYSKIRPNLSKVIIVDFKGLCSADMYPISSKIEPRYLQTFMLSGAFLGQVVQGDNRLAMPKVNQQQLSATIVPVPPLAEQKRIVVKVDQLMALCDELETTQIQKQVTGTRLTRSALEALTSAEGPEEFAAAWQRVADNFELLIQNPAALEQLRTLILTLATQGKITTPATEFSSASIELNPTHEAEPPPFDLPKTWRWHRVEQVGELKLGRQRSPKNHVGPYMRPYLRVANVFEARIDTSDVLQMNFTPEEAARFELKPNDILLNEGQSHELVGRPAIYRGEVPGACFQNTLIRFRPYELVLPEFALLVFRAYMRNGRFRREAQQTTNIAHLSLGRLASIEFPLPPVSEQSAIIAKVDQLMALCDELEARLRDAEKGAQRLAEAMTAAMVA